MLLNLGLVAIGGALYLIYRVIKAFYRKLFKLDGQLTNLKRESIDKNYAGQYSVDLKKNRVNDNRANNNRVNNNRVNNSATRVDSNNSIDDK